jgi:hypothetical protein
MKTLTKPTILAIVVLVTCVAALSPTVKPISPFEREQTKGNVRVVLLKVERSTIFTSEGIRKPEQGKVYPVPTFGITYLVEALGDEPIKNWNADETDEDYVLGNRKVLDDSTLPENLIPGSHGANHPPSLFANGPMALPKLTNAKRAVVKEIFLRAPPTPAGALRLKLKVGLNDKTEKFSFDGIPVN